MIITLEEAKKIDKDLTNDDIIALEVAIREITNENFQNINVRFRVDKVIEPNIIKVTDDIKGLRLGSRIELNNSNYNDELHTVKQIRENEIEVANDDLLDEDKRGMIVTLVKYPLDVKQGVKKLLQYDKKTKNNIGVKSRSVSRVTETYYDVTSGENVNGYPSSLFDFITKYKKIGWGT